jgi:fructose-specific phosphotransferase system IIC component
MTIYKALLAGVSIVLSEVVFTTVYAALHVAIVRRSENVAYGLFAAAAITIGSPLYWLLLVVLVSGISWLFTRHC